MWPLSTQPTLTWHDRAISPKSDQHCSNFSRSAGIVPYYQTTPSIPYSTTSFPPVDTACVFPNAGAGKLSPDLSAKPGSLTSPQKPSPGTRTSRKGISRPPSSTLAVVSPSFIHTHSKAAWDPEIGPGSQPSPYDSRSSLPQPRGLAGIDTAPRYFLNPAIDSGAIRYKKLSYPLQQN